MTRRFPFVKEKWPPTQMSNQSFSYLLIGPTLLLFLALGLIPLLYSFGLSLFQYKLNTGFPPKFIGLGNYLEMLKDTAFLQTIPKTIYYTIGTVGLSTLFGLVIALVLNESIILKGLLMILLLLPWSIPRVVNGLIWKWIFDGTYGVLNAILFRLGIIQEYQWWFVKSPLLGMTMIIIADVWKNTPFSALLLTTAIQYVPRELYDAAMCDGANAWVRFRKITIPHINYTLVVTILLQMMWSLHTFDLIQVLTKGGPKDNTTISYYYVYKQAFSYLNLGYGTALAYFLTFVTILLTVFYLKTVRKD
jgi:multiple sugar transport system permease protein